MLSRNAVHFILGGWSFQKQGYKDYIGLYRDDIGLYRDYVGLYRGYIGIMEKKMETTI